MTIRVIIGMVNALIQGMDVDYIIALSVERWFNEARDNGLLTEEMAEDIGHYVQMETLDDAYELRRRLQRIQDARH